jgi:hypothetical protein
MRRKLRYTAAALFLSLGSSAFGQNEATELANLVETAEKAALREHKLALEALEKERAALGDYAGARRAKAAWESFVSQYFPEVNVAATSAPVSTAPR